MGATRAANLIRSARIEPMPGTHVGRPLDFSYRSNQLIAAVVGVASVAALLLWITQGLDDAWRAPINAFVLWALLREIDPDHDWTALAGAVAIAAWVLLGQESIGPLPLAGMMVSARVLTGTTGLRPLPTDLLALAALASAIAFTPEGWAAGFGLGIALYADERFAPGEERAGVVAGAAAALGASVVATLAGVFPEAIPETSPVVLPAAAIASILLVSREPTQPKSREDHGDQVPLDRGRLHAARSLLAVVVFAAAALAGQGAYGLWPVIFALALAIASNELGPTER